MPLTQARQRPAFRFVDLFAGIGGFHAALSALGGECVYASEIDPAAANVYERNWGMPVDGDIIPATTDRMDVPDHDVLAAGFPCQPFSKSGYQRGMDEARGTLFWNICRILEERQPAVVLLENVRNLAGPRHEHEWDVIVRTLRELGYRVSSTPAVFSPHLLPPELGGRPQVRERVFIVGTLVGPDEPKGNVDPIVRNKPIAGWDPHSWSLADHLPLAAETAVDGRERYALTASEEQWINAWDDFIQTLRLAGVERLPGFPIWRDEFRSTRSLKIDPETPAWKVDFLRKNAELYTKHQRAIDAWLGRWNRLAHFPPSRRKLEWQAQDARSLWDTVMHFRPSGIRAKRASYVPALVAITQTSIVGDRSRRITPREGARLQGLPEWFDFGEQREALTYKQLGNGVNVGVAYHVLRQHVLRDAAAIKREAPRLVRAVRAAAESPDLATETYKGLPPNIIVRTRDGHLIQSSPIEAAG
jgi:DNA (cytosine-5)-methyltransferase 1